MDFVKKGLWIKMAGIEEEDSGDTVKNVESQKWRYADVRYVWVMR